MRPKRGDRDESALGRLPVFSPKFLHAVREMTTRKLLGRIFQRH